MIVLRQVSKIYPTPKGTVTALHPLDLKIHRGEFIAITGKSGSGKSTLLAILGCLDQPSTGEYFIDKVAIQNASEDWLAKLRNRHIGFVFQQYNLISRFNALENVELPMIYANISKPQRQRRASMALRAVGLGERALHRPAELSGGQQQRVAIARALVNNPQLIFADEPTGSLDDQSTYEVMGLFRQLHLAGKTIVFVTHNRQLLSYASRVLILDKGSLVQDHVTHY